MVPNNRFIKWSYSDGSKFYWGTRFYGNVTVYDSYEWDWNPDHSNRAHDGWDAIYP
jgi:hypothetical protein